MTPTEIIRAAATDGVRLSISPDGNIRATGKQAAINHWLPYIREQKAEIQTALRQTENPLSKMVAGELSNSFVWWRVRYSHGAPVETSCCPSATHAEILKWAPEAIAAGPFELECRQPSAPLTIPEKVSIEAWLADIGEDDPETIAYVLNQCHLDVDARASFVKEAKQRRD